MPDQVVNQKISNSKVPKGGDKNSIFLNSMPYLIPAWPENLPVSEPFSFYIHSLLNCKPKFGKHSLYKKK